jgi:hypothetical protein
MVLYSQKCYQSGQSALQPQMPLNKVKVKDKKYQSNSFSDAYYKPGFGETCCKDV